MLTITVLLVDDEEAFRSTLAKRLGKRGISVREAGTGEEALAIAEAWEPDVVLLDVKMPGMDGLTVLHRLKEEDPLI